MPTFRNNNNDNLIPQLNLFRAPDILTATILISYPYLIPIPNISLVIVYVQDVPLLAPPPVWQDTAWAYYFCSLHYCVQLGEQTAQAAASDSRHNR